MLDIVDGDILTVGSTDYRVKSVSAYMGFGVTPSFLRMARTTASTKRPATMTNGLRGTASTYLTGLKITPLDPVAAELAITVATKTPYLLRQCFAADSTGYVQLVVEELKG